ncbi:MAG: IS3 family transposase [Coriobacteriia bacterium]|nr:IS3 family transposase [Coriobacteriia bacterium]
MKYEAIDRLKGQHSVAKMARVLEINQSAYYQWRKRQEANLIKRDAEKALVEKVRSVFDDNRQVYGYRKMMRALQAQGINISIYKVRRIMRENGLFSVTGHKWRPKRESNRNGRYLDNLLNQDFKVDAPNKVWAGDITHIKTSLGWVQMAVVLDLCTKEVLGYKIARNATTELVKQALADALVNSGKNYEQKIIFHSDRGTQYTSKSFQAMCEACNITSSMSAAGCPYDNAVVESFFSTAKREEIFRKQYAGIDEAKTHIFDYIELFYNRKRIQQGLNYLSPKEYRKKLEMTKVEQ